MNARARKRATLLLGVLGGSFLTIAACSTTLQGTLALVTGPDDGFAMTPQPTSLLVQLTNISNNSTTSIARIALPTDSSVALPSQPGSNIDIIQVTGFDDAGDAVVSGSSIPVALDQLGGLTLNLFVQRTGQFSRLPSLDGGTAMLTGAVSSKPLLTTLYSRYLLIADGTGKSTATQLYDTLTWQVIQSSPPLPMKPSSLAFVDNYTGTDAAADGSATVAALLTVGPDGGWKWLDLTDSTSADAEVILDAGIPAGGQLSDVAGGQTIATTSGMLYIVGATRQSGRPTTAVLRISSSGVASWATLVTARLGAAAVWVNSPPGLYIFGGTSSDDAGAQAMNGVEFLSDDSQSATLPRPGLPADTTTGAGALALDNNHVLLAGGVTPKGKPAPVRFYTITDLTTFGDAGSGTGSSTASDAGRDAGRDATSDAGSDAGRDATSSAGRDAGRDVGSGTGSSAASAASSSTASGAGSDAGASWPALPVTFKTAQVFGLTNASSPLGSYSAVVVGTESSGATSAYLLTPTSVTPLPFRVPRSHAQAILLPNFSLGVVGGDSGTLESFIR